MEGNKDEEPAKDEDETKLQANEASKATISKSGLESHEASRIRTEGAAEEPLSEPRSTDPQFSEVHFPDSTVRESSSVKKYDLPSSKSKVQSDGSRLAAVQSPEKVKSNVEEGEDVTDGSQKRRPYPRPDIPIGIVGCLTAGLPSFDNFSCSKFFAKRSPFAHNPPQPEERRPRIDRPRCPRDYIINLREDLADFQESHGLPRTRDYSFMSLGLALAQETARAICSVFLMFSELFPVVAIISLVLRFALDKLIDILETNEPVPKLKKTLIFCLQMIMILIPLWILIGTIVLPLAGLLLSIFRKLLRFKGGKSARISCGQPKKQGSSSSGFKKIESSKGKPPPCPSPPK